MIPAKAFKWLGPGVMDLVAGEAVRVLYPGDLVDAPAELEALGNRRVEELVAHRQGTYNLDDPLPEDVRRALRDPEEIEIRKRASAEATAYRKKILAAAAEAERFQGGSLGQDAARGEAIPGLGSAAREGVRS